MQIVIKKGGPPDFTPWEPTTWRRVLESPHGLPRILMLARWPKEVFDSWRVRRATLRLLERRETERLRVLLLDHFEARPGPAATIPAHEPCDCRFCDDYRTHKRD